MTDNPKVDESRVSTKTGGRVKGTPNKKTNDISMPNADFILMKIAGKFLYWKVMMVEDKFGELAF